MSSPHFKSWIKKAESDYAAALLLARSRKKGMADIVCYHCQQCAEKYLKAFLVLHRISFPKTHDLEKLLELAKTFDVLLNVIEEEIKFLNPYSIVSRYPGEEASTKEAKQALVKAASVKKFLQKTV
jgi:HEPN domain-containing protein